MGLNSRVFDLMAQFGKRNVADGRVLVAGYPDFLVHPEILIKHLGHCDFPIAPFSEQIKIGHNEPDLDHSRDARAVFKALGYPTMDVVDLYPERGCERRVDLNERQDLGEYDLVLDHGTIEHCFNIAEAARNLASTVCESGIIVQHLPLNLYNHGFYNLSPTWFYDFYGLNGFEILHFEGWCMESLASYPLPAFADFSLVPRSSLLTMVARRIQMQPITFPIQGRYRR